MGIDSAENVFEVFLRTDVIGFATGDQALKNSGSFLAALTANKRKVLSLQTYAFDITLGKIIVWPEAQVQYIVF